MAGEQFHIYIHDGANTVAYGRDFLREQDAELNRAMTEFMQACKEEKEAFDQSVDAMGNQCYNSAQLVKDAENAVWKATKRLEEAEWCRSRINDFILPAEENVSYTERLVESANSMIQSAENSVANAKNSIAGYQNQIKEYELQNKHDAEEIKKEQAGLKQAQKNNDTYWINAHQDSIKSYQNYIEYRNSSDIYHCKQDLKHAREELGKAQEELDRAQKMKDAAEKALAAARQHLELCQQKLAEAEALKRRAEALKQKACSNLDNAEKAQKADEEKLHELKSRAKESARSLGELSDNSLSIQRNASDNLCDNAAIMDKLSGLMYDYETYSLDGGKL